LTMEIEEGISQADGSPYYYIDLGSFKTKEEAVQIRQQILQDREDAKHLKHIKEMSSGKEITKLIDEQIQSQKDRETVKRLKEGLSQWKMNGSIPAWIVHELQKILEGKK